MHFEFNNEDLCTKNEEFCIKSDGFCGVHHAVAVCGEVGPGDTLLVLGASVRAGGGGPGESPG